jgi:hypothetical protein
MKGLKINTKVNIKLDLPIFETFHLNEFQQSKAECHHILDNIYISGYRWAQDEDFLTSNNFTHILNCAVGSRNFITQTFENIDYLLLDIKDDPAFDIIFPIYSTIDFLEKGRSIGKVLIHCAEVRH